MIGRPVGSPAGCADGGGGGERREQAQSEAEAVHLHHVRPSLAGPPRGRPAALPGLACCSCREINHIRPARTRRGIVATARSAAPRRPHACRRPPVSARSRPPLDEDRALAVLREATAGADDGELFLERRRGESLVFDDGRLKNAAYDAAEGFGLRAVQRRDRRLRAFDRDLRGGAPARRRDRAARGRRRRRHARGGRRGRPTSGSTPTATRSTTPSSR